MNAKTIVYFFLPLAKECDLFMQLLKQLIDFPVSFGVHQTARFSFFALLK